MIPWDWNTTPQERAARFACDGYLDSPVRRLTRAITITAPPPTVFRWLCQLKVAPYSYDWLNNRGRRSPRRLTPGAERLAHGQRFGVFELVEFQQGQSLTGVVQPRFERIYGPLAGTYAIQPRHDGTCRLVVRLAVGATTPLQRVRRVLLAWGDLVMMRKQLRTLKQLAELQEREGQVVVWRIRRGGRGEKRSVHEAGHQEHRSRSRAGSTGTGPSRVHVLCRRPGAASAADRVAVA